MFAGNPDTVVRQIKEFRRRVGGVGRIIMMTRQGLMTHEEAMKSFSLTAREVLPQLQDLEPLDDGPAWRREPAHDADAGRRPGARSAARWRRTVRSC